ncbi:MAG: serine/threonine protein kinase [Pseudanabaena sp. CRU_2_10]|nr:serine/threonine protein kinase [Pseudanabaena sp. CRU_2_10]
MIDSTLAGHYQVVRHLGGGSFGQTFLAKDKHLPGNPLCVIKQLKPKADDAETLEIAKRLFNREAETLYKLGNHDRIPRLMAHFEQDGEFYLVQEYIEGRSLDTEITPGKQWSEADVVVLLRNTLEVLAFIHQQNVIHRDIKPANLIERARDNKIVLIDFGAVKEISNQTADKLGLRNTETVAIGTLDYMPNEQVAGHPQFASDIYAVGMMCLQALTGLTTRDLPKDAQTNEYSCALCSDRAKIRINRGLATILDNMVLYDYRQRYQNAADCFARRWSRSMRMSQQLFPPYCLLTRIPMVTPMVKLASALKFKPMYRRT